jgi:uncharacterized delta-60 repeat protein
VAVGPYGGIYVVGETTSFSAGGGRDVFVLKYNQRGKLIWQKVWRNRGSGGTRLSAFVKGVAVGSDENIYVVGATRDPRCRRLRSDAFILKFDPDAGDLRWQKGWGGNDLDPAWDVAVDKYGDIYVVGFTHSFGVHVPTPDVFILKYDSDGNLILQKTWGGSGGDWARSVAVRPDGGIYVVGETTSFEASGGLDAFVLKYDRHGQLGWQRTWGGKLGDGAWDAAVSPDGGIYVVGETRSFEVGGGLDASILKYDSDGNLIWDKTWGANDLEDAQGVAAVDNKRFVVVGTTTSSIRRTLRDVRGRTSTPPGVENTLSQPDYTLFGDVITPNGREKKPIGEPSKGNGDAYLIYL